MNGWIARIDASAAGRRGQMGIRGGREVRRLGAERRTENLGRQHRPAREFVVRTRGGCFKGDRQDPIRSIGFRDDGVADARADLLAFARMVVLAASVEGGWRENRHRREDDQKALEQENHVVKVTCRRIDVNGW